MSHLYGCFLMYNNKYILFRNIWSINQNVQGLWLICVSGVRKIAFGLSQAIPALGSGSNPWHWGHKSDSVQSRLFALPHNLPRHPPLGLKFSVLCLCPRRVLDSCILGGRAERGIIFPSLPWQGQWDNICKVAGKFSFSPKRWMQPTAGSGWLRHLEKHLKNAVFYQELQGVTWQRVWYSPRASQRCTGNAYSHFWGAPLPGIIPMTGRGQGTGISARECKIFIKMPGPPCSGRFSVLV